MKTCTAQDLLAERRANLGEMPHVDASERAWLKFENQEIDRELRERRREADKKRGVKRLCKVCHDRSRRGQESTCGDCDNDPKLNPERYS